MTKIGFYSFVLALLLSLPAPQAQAASPVYSANERSLLDKRPELARMLAMSAAPDEATLRRQIAALVAKAPIWPESCAQQSKFVFAENRWQSLAFDADINKAIEDNSVINVWRGAVKLPDCPLGVERQIIATQTEKGWSVALAYYGVTQAWPALLSKTLPQVSYAAQILAQQQMPSCTEEPRLVQQLVQEPNAAPMAFGIFFSGQWREEWLFSTCGIRASVVIDFAADGRGGANSSIAGSALIDEPPPEANKAVNTEANTETKAETAAEPATEPAAEMPAPTDTTPAETAPTDTAP